MGIFENVKVEFKSYKMRGNVTFFIFSNLCRWTSCMRTCSAPSGESSRTGSSREPCRVSIIWLPRCTCNGQVSKWAEPTRRCSAIGSAFYRVSKLPDSSWSTAPQGRVTVSWSRRQPMPTVSTQWAGSTPDTDEHLWPDPGAHVHTNTRHTSHSERADRTKETGEKLVQVSSCELFCCQLFKSLLVLSLTSPSSGDVGDSPLTQENTAPCGFISPNMEKNCSCFFFTVMLLFCSVNKQRQLNSAWSHCKQNKLNNNYMRKCHLTCACHNL